MDELALRALYEYSQTPECQSYELFETHYCKQRNLSNVRQNIRFLEGRKLSTEDAKHKRALNTVIELIVEWSKDYPNTRSFEVPWDFSSFDIYLSANRNDNTEYTGVRILWHKKNEHSVVCLRKYPEASSNECDEICWKITNRSSEVLNDSEY